MIGQAHETEGSYPRPRGAMVGKPRRLLSTALRGSTCPRAPGLVGELSPAFSSRTRRLASRNRHHGWGGERTGLQVLSQRGCSVGGELLMLSQHVDAWCGEIADAFSSELTLSPAS